jgi:hypothetical protein
MMKVVRSEGVISQQATSGSWGIEVAVFAVAPTFRKDPLCWDLPEPAANWTSRDAKRTSPSSEKRSECYLLASPCAPIGG